MIDSIETYDKAIKGKKDAISKVEKITPDSIHCFKVLMKYLKDDPIVQKLKGFQITA